MPLRITLRSVDVGARHRSGEHLHGRYALADAGRRAAALSDRSSRAIGIRTRASLSRANVATKDQARRQARMLKDQHTGVIAWSREANPDVGEFGPPEVLAVYGDVPEME